MLSKKKENELYSVIHEEIIVARVKLEKLIKDSPNYKAITKILFNLNVETPQVAIDLFKKKEKC